jgi:hypothetical protein
MIYLSYGFVLLDFEDYFLHFINLQSMYLISLEKKLLFNTFIIDSLAIMMTTNKQTNNHKQFSKM